MKPHPKVTIKDIRKGHRLVCKHSVEIGDYCTKCKMDAGDQVITLLVHSGCMTGPVFDHYMERIEAMEDAVP